MKTLFPAQRTSADFLKAALLKHKAALDSSATGVGKTVVAAQVAKELGFPVAVVCPKIVIPSWKREFEEVGIHPIFVTNHEKIKRGTTTHLAKLGKKLFRWNLPPDTLLIWDEVHKCAGAFTQNAQMLIASVQAGFYNLLLSATACQDPTEMRAIGYALGLHGLNRGLNDGRASWFTWMLQLGCSKDQWNQWKAGGQKHLVALNQRLYSTNCVKLTPRDLPSYFSDNHIITEPLSFAGCEGIKRFYDDHGITPEIVDMFLDGQMSSPHVMVQILRARQLAEAAKVPDIIDMIWDARSEGYSVAVFVNFTDTLRAIQAAFPSGCSVVCGGQKDEEREDLVQKFQDNTNRVIICNAAAGGVGVSLHDTRGTNPRISLISPTFDVKTYVQVLGRIHRAGAKSPSTQRILVTSGTIEERVLQRMEEKRKAMDTLHAQPA